MNDDGPSDGIFGRHSPLDLCSSGISLAFCTAARAGGEPDLGPGEETKSWASSAVLGPGAGACGAGRVKAGGAGRGAERGGPALAAALALLRSGRGWR